MAQIRPSKVQKRELVAEQPLEEHEEAQEVRNPIRITALVVSHNRVDLLRRAIQSLEKSEEREKLEILVVDNGSTDGSADLESEFPTARFIRIPRNFGLTKALNIGVRGAAGEYVLLLHEDTEVAPETARALAQVFENQPDAGAVCPLLVTPDGDPAPQIGDLPRPGQTRVEWRPADPAAGEQPVEYARGAALMLRSFSLKSMRQIDEKYGNYGSDAELCFQVQRAGKRVLLEPSTHVVHHGRLVTDRVMRARRAADCQLGMATYIRKRYGLARWLGRRITDGLAAFGGLATFRDFGYRCSYFIQLWNGQKIDGTQRD